MSCHVALTSTKSAHLEKRNRSWNKVVTDIGSKANHGQASVLELLHAHVLLLRISQGSPSVGPVNGSGAVASVGLALELGPVLDALQDTAQKEELGPPLGVSLGDGLDGVGGGDVVGGKGPEEFGKEPADVGQHGRSAVAELGLAQKVDGGPLSQADRVELCAITSERATMVVKMMMKMTTVCAR
jgi:hypothetical protein